MRPETSLLTSDPLLHNLPLESGQTALTPLSQSLRQVLEQRRSERLFSSRPVPAPVLAQLLWAACGENRRETGQRTAPSAKNWQEIDIYVAQEDGLFLFEPAAGALRQLGQRDVRAATGWQDFVAGAPINLVYVADLAKMERAPRWEQKFYAALDTGFISQNVYLFCAAQGLATLGLPAEGVIARAQADANKLALRCQTERAAELGLFGAPSFRVGEELFWGNDRLEDALAWARRA